MQGYTLVAHAYCSPDGKKKAYVRLTADHDALDVANKVRFSRFFLCMQRFSKWSVPRLASSKWSIAVRYPSSSTHTPRTLCSALLRMHMYSEPLVLPAAVPHDMTHPVCVPHNAIRPCKTQLVEGHEM